MEGADERQRVVLYEPTIVPVDALGGRLSKAGRYTRVATVALAESI